MEEQGIEYIRFHSKFYISLNTTKAETINMWYLECNYHFQVHSSPYFFSTKSGVIALNSFGELYRASTTAKLQEAVFNFIEDVSPVQKMVTDSNETMIIKTDKHVVKNKHSITNNVRHRCYWYKANLFLSG